MIETKKITVVKGDKLTYNKIFMKEIKEIDYMNVLYIANFLYGQHCGAQSVAKAHLDVLKCAFGRENVITMALVGTEKVSSENYIIEYIKPNIFFRGLNLLMGNTGKINSKIVLNIERIIKDRSVDLVFVDDSIYGKLIKKLKYKYPNIKIVSYYHDVKRNLCKEWIRNDKKRFLIYCSLILNEYLTQKYADFNFVLNKREEEVFKKYYHKSPEMLLPIVLPTPECSNRLETVSNMLEILFIGSYYYPNVNGIDWFIKNVLINLNYPVRLVVVGNQMDKIKDQYIGISNVIIKGKVEDLTKFYENADVIIGPIFEGAGMKVKTAEAFSYGKCFVGTDESLEGYSEFLDSSLLNKYIFRCNSQNEFINALKQISYSDNIYKFNKDVFNFFEKYYSVKAAANGIRYMLLKS